MLRRTVLFGLALALIVPAAAQAETAHVRPPIEARDLTIEADQADILLGEGTSSAAASIKSGSIVVWEQRTPCFDDNPESCFWERSETSRTASEFDSGSLTLEPRVPKEHKTVIGLAQEGRFSLTADEAALAIRSSSETVTLTENDDAPEDLRRAELPEGLDEIGQRGDLLMEGKLLLQTTASTLTLEANGSEDGPRQIQTGVKWKQGQDGFDYRIERLAKLTFTGGLTSAWDGLVRATPSLPAPVTAASAHVNVTEGQLGDANATNSPAQIRDLEATIVEAVAPSGGSPDEDREGDDDRAPASAGHFVVEQGTRQVATPDETAQEGVSRTTVVGAGSAAAIAVLLTAYYWPRLSWLGTVLVLPLYSRIEKDELFENETREALYEQIKEDPGVHAHALSEAVDIGWGTTVYHLRRLERNGFVHSEKRGRYRRFFPASGFVEQQREVLSVLQNETTNDIAALVREQPGLNQSAICEELDISPSLANWHLNRLIDADLVDRERRGRTVHYTPGDAWKALERLGDLEAPDVLGDAQAA